MAGKFLSILICHYKETEFQITRLLESLQFNSKYSSLIEFYIYNDGNENIIPDSLLNKFSLPLTYKICAKQGTSKLRNKMINECNGKFIWFIDSDDYLINNSIDAVIEKLLSNQDLELLQVGCAREGCSYKTFYLPGLTNYSIVCCNILNKQFLLKNNLLCDESVNLAGDIVIETLPKWYAKKHDKLWLAAFEYTFNKQSVVRQQKKNGWKSEQVQVIDNIITRLLNEHKINCAYIEYINFVMYFNNKQIHDKYAQLFKNLKLYNLPRRLDLR